jgi:hypothetical protein
MLGGEDALKLAHVFRGKADPGALHFDQHLIAFVLPRSDQQPARLVGDGRP